MVGWIRRLGLALVVSLAACGDGAFIISFNTGVIAGDPLCRGAGGQFDLLESGGLRILVVITDSTDIIVAGSVGRCTDLFADAAVNVSGRQSGDRIVASSVTVE